MPNLIEKYLSQGLNVGAYNISEYWLGIENMENLKKVEKRVNKKIFEMNGEKILIVIPTYNEASIIEKLILEIQNNFEKADILVIDAYSNDETFKKVKSTNTNIIQIDKIFGIGLAIETAILFAKKNNYDFLVRIDGDGQHPPEDVKDVLKFAMSKKNDLTIGSRFLSKSEYNPNYLRLYSIKLRKLINLLYGANITDCTSGCQILSKILLKESQMMRPLNTLKLV